MDLEHFKILLEHCVPHALTRYGDGEKNIFNNIDCYRKGFKFDSKNDQDFRHDLIDSYNYKSNHYFVADKKPISACLFVNENYEKFFGEILPIFINYKITLVCHKNVDLTFIPFKVAKVFFVSNNAWKHESDLDLKILDSINHTKQNLVLFACGPYSNVLIYRLWIKSNIITLWNIGSTLDPIFYKKFTREYQKRITWKNWKYNNE